MCYVDTTVFYLMSSHRTVHDGMVAAFVNNDEQPDLRIPPPHDAGIDCLRFQVQPNEQMNEGSFT